MLPEDPEVLAGREVSSQAELYHKTKEAEAMVEEQLEVWLQWTKMPDLMMDAGTEVEMPEVTAKRKREEVA